MNMPQASFLRWQQQFSTEEDYLTKMKWPKGFICPCCAHDQSYAIGCRRLYECTHCKNQTSVMVGALFNGSHISLVKWS